MNKKNNKNVNSECIYTLKNYNSSMPFCCYAYLNMHASLIHMQNACKSYSYAVCMNVLFMCNMHACLIHIQYSCIFRYLH